MSLHNYFKNWIPNLFSCATCPEIYLNINHRIQIHIYTYIHLCSMYKHIQAFEVGKLLFHWINYNFCSCLKKKKILISFGSFFFQSFWGEQINNSFKDNPRKNWELYEVPVIFNNLIVDCVTRAVSRSLRLVNF